MLLFVTTFARIVSLVGFGLKLCLNIAVPEYALGTTAFNCSEVSESMFTIRAMNLVDPAAPIINRTNEDPFGMASPFVMVDNGIFKMWYASYRKWDLRDGDPWPQYQIRYAESKDGINWDIKNIICLGSDMEEAVARPYIIKENNKYLMWYCHRLQFGTYRIGYAESFDGIKWTRKDKQVGIDVSDSGWDSEMIEYPCVFKYKNDKYMLYNGNNFGIDGIGLAKLER